MDSIYDLTERYLDTLEMVMEIEWDEEYLGVRNRLYSMSPLRRWLSFRLRKKYGRLRQRQQQMIFNQVIYEGLRREE